MIETLQDWHPAPHAFNVPLNSFRMAVSVTLRVTSLGATWAEVFAPTRRSVGQQGKRWGEVWRGWAGSAAIDHGADHDVGYGALSRTMSFPDEPIPSVLWIS